MSINPPSLADAAINLFDLPSLLSADLSATRRQVGRSSSSLSISPAGHFTLEIAQLFEFQPHC
jgi:hypothetical protein